MNATRDAPTKWRRTIAEWAMALAIIVVLLALLLPQQIAHREASPRTNCRNNLRQMALALHNYHDVHGTFPPAYVSDENGRPMHSWRVLILPYLDQQTLYEQYDLNEPWDGPNNIKLLEQRPDVYACPSHAGDPTITAYAAIVGEDCVFRGTQPVGIPDIADGTSNTGIIGEAVHARIRWTEPRDISFGAFAGMGHSEGFLSDHKGGGFVLRADGSVEFVSDNSDPKWVRAMFTRAGGEDVPVPE